MPRVLPSEAHPDETVRHALGSAEPFDLGPGGVYESDDREVIANATAHPWLTVEFEEQQVLQGRYREPSVSPQDDVLGSARSVAFDPEAIREAEENKVLADERRLGIDAGLDQGESHEAGGIATTLAAADDVADDTPDEQPDEPGEEY